MDRSGIVTLEDVDTDSMSVQELRELKEHQENYFQQISQLVHDAAVEYGEQIRQSTGMSRSKHHWRLEDFFGFDLEKIGGYNGRYTDDYKIIRDGETLLHLHTFRGSGNWAVEEYQEGPWEYEIDAMLENSGEMLDEFEEELERREERAEKARKAEERARAWEQEREELAEELERQTPGEEAA